MRIKVVITRGLNAPFYFFASTETFGCSTVRNSSAAASLAQNFRTDLKISVNFLLVLLWICRPEV